MVSNYVTVYLRASKGEVWGCDNRVNNRVLTCVNIRF